jgi:cell pole-organizing protein PopZ
LRPLLKSWLDENLPQIVERIVREEIGRLALDAQRR